MKKLLVLSVVMMLFSVGCNKDNQDMQREEEMDRSDISPGAAPSNVGDIPVTKE